MPFTYLIGWTKYNIWYYGVRFAKNCTPSDLWTVYFTSSKRVKLYRKQYGEPDVVQLRHVFMDSASAREWEQKVIRRMNAVSSQKWLNQSDNGNKFYHEGPRGEFSDKHRANISNAMKGNKNRLGKPCSEKTKQKLRDKRKNFKHTPETIEKIKVANKATMNTPEFKAKRKLTRATINTPEYRQFMSEHMKRVWIQRKASV